VLNSTMRGQKSVWCCLGVCLGLLTAPAFNAEADATLTFSTVFAFDLNSTAAGVVDAQVNGTHYLYGSIINTSLSYGGAIYRVGLNGGAPQTIYQLKDTDGYDPSAGLLVATDPSQSKTYLYGATKYGPKVGNVTNTGPGTLFRVAPDGTGYTTLHTFAAATNNIYTEGVSPDFALIDGGDGYAYGVTTSGGTNNTGTIFRMKLDGTVFQKLHDFAALDVNGLNADGQGAVPTASLVLANGRLYGVTQYGGTNPWTSGCSTDGSTTCTTTSTGTIYSLNPDGSDFQTIYNFTPLDTSTGTGATGRNPDGVLPKGALLYEPTSGLLVGTAVAGGQGIDSSSTIGYGTVFSLATDGTPAGTTFTTLHSFTGVDGSSPFGNLMLANDGLIYGMTSGGTNSTTTPYSAYGTVFSIDTSGGFNLAYGFITTDVSGLTGGLIQASDGNFYGTGTSGGACPYYGGAVYRLSSTGSTTTNPYSNCTATTSSGGGSMSPGLLWLLAALGLAPPVRRRLFTFK
jgi:uncharacterized repeat protein (TIGR03803 family)